MIKDRSTMTIKYDSFTGFTFGEYHTSQFHLIRTSDGSRYNDETFAQAKDTTITVPGMDGSLYVSSQRQNRVFNLKFAYDGLTEEDIFDIREWFASDKEQKLIFDERPYCYYMGKVTGAPKLSYICFDTYNDDGSLGPRVYKGEGTVTITCYYPYAKSCTPAEGHVDASQWASFVPSIAAGTSNINNEGHLPSPLKFQFTFSDGATTGSIKLKRNDGAVLGQIHFSATEEEAKKTYLYDSELHLITSNDVVNNSTVTSVQNGIILAGDFFNLPVGKGYALEENDVTISGVEYSYIYY